MISIFALWMYIFFVTSSCGFIVYNIACKTKLIAEIDTPRIDLLSIVGLCVITAFLGFYHIFFKIGLYANIVLLLISATSFILNIKEYERYFNDCLSYLKNRYILWIPLILSISLVLIKSVTSQAIYDTGLYHAQNIKWIEEYSVVPGLGNIHGRFAFNSSFFLPCALFSFSFLDIQPFHHLNSYLFLVFSISMIYYSYEGITNRKKISFFCLSITILSYGYFITWLSSPTPDVPAAIFLWLVFLVLIDKTESDSVNIFDFNYLSALVISLTAITIKLSTVPIFLVISYIILVCRKSLQAHKYFKIVLAGSLIILPWGIRNVIVSGYLIYPLALIDLFDFDWKIPAESVINLKGWIYSWAIMPGRPLSEVLALPMKEWFPVWFKRLHIVNKIPFLIVSISPFAIGFYCWFNFNKLDRINRHLITYWFICYVGVLFWFFTAPDFRFGYGFVSLCSLITLSFFIKDTIFSYKGIGLFVVMGLSLFVTVLLFNSNAHLSKNWLFPEGYRTVQTITKSNGNLHVFVPKRGDQCWNEPLPCTPYFNNDIELRGSCIADGFRTRK